MVEKNKNKEPSRQILQIRKLWSKIRLLHGDTETPVHTRDCRVCRNTLGAFCPSFKMTMRTDEIYPSDVYWLQKNKDKKKLHWGASAAHNKGDSVKCTEKSSRIEFGHIKEMKIKACIIVILVGLNVESALTNPYTRYISVEQTLQGNILSTLMC